MKWLKQPLGWTVIFTLVLFVLAMVFAPSVDKVAEAQLPWNSSYNSQGELEALGLTLQKSTLKDALQLYGNDVEVKLFDLNGERVIEAYYASAYIGTIHAALIVKLDLNEAELERYYDRGARTTVSQHGAREVKLNNTDTLELFDFPIRELNLVPRRNLTEEALAKRFGEPDSRTKDAEDEQVERLTYKAKGLEIVLIEGDKDILRYK